MLKGLFMKPHILLTICAATAYILGANKALAANDIPAIIVHANGEASAMPNQAILELGVSSHAKTAQAALSSNNKAMNSIVEALQKQHIAKADMQTSQLSLYETNQSTKNDETATYSYNIESHLTVLVRDLDNLAKIYDTAIENGANQSGELSFKNNKKDIFLQEARAKAVQGARSKAETLAKAAGVKLGQILNITENMDDNYPLSTSRAMALSSTSSNLPPVESGQINYKISVTMSFAIKQN